MKLVFVVTALCAVTALAQDQAAMPVAESACGPAGVQFDVRRDNKAHAIAQPEAGKALVYVVQDMGPGPCPWSCVTTRVGLDGAWVGANNRNSYISFSVDAGERHLCVSRQSSIGLLAQMTSLAHFTAEAGKTYYFRARTISSREVLFLDLDPIDSDEGRYLIASYPLSVSHPHK
jgi:hypothetical protein